jgi:hypothetical protein
VIWVGWRQQRTEALIAAGVFVLLLALLVPTGIEMANAYSHDGLSGCVSAHPSSACLPVIESFTTRFEQLSGLLSWFNLVPGIIGVLLAAPFVIELETGTHRLAWTQSITRRRWITTKLAIAVGGAVVAGAAMTLLLTWWRTPLDHLYGRMDRSVFDFEGTVTIGYTLFALALALAIGTVWRRTVPAVITGFAGYVVARLFVDGWLRQRYEAPVAVTFSNSSGSSGPDLAHAWVLTEEPTDRFGRAMAFPLGLVGTCGRAINGHAATISPACLTRHGAAYTHVVYIPASRFWTFQGIETALFAGTAVVLIVLAGWWTHRRAA